MKTLDLPRVRVRLVRPDEGEQLREVRLSALAYSRHLARHLEEEASFPLQFWHERAEQAARATGPATFVAVHGEAFMGVADGFLTEDRRTVEVGGMWVRSEHRRRGIGRQLLAAVCD